jgi:hypothetical protein
VRAIARDLAMTALTVHYYFPSRQGPLGALLGDGFTSLPPPPEGCLHISGGSSQGKGGLNSHD